MQLAFLKIPVAERSLYFQQAALRQAMHPAIMEKDFWVCFLLKVLFEHPELSSHIVFKGGTSLSKVARVIDRFSEDIDLSLSPEFIGIDENEVEQAGSRTRRDQWMTRLEKTCTKATCDKVLPALEQAITIALGPCLETAQWLENVVDEASHSPVILFHYPTVAEGFSYLPRTIKLEFGSLTDQRPTGRHSIKPWLADVLPEVFHDWKCEVVSLEVERTFWEKATILHVEAHRSLTDRIPIRYSRHYSDLAAMSKNPVATRALEQTELRDRVVAWKSKFFARTWAHYDLACPGTFKLLPPEVRRSELAVDYEEMKPMFIHTPPPFEEIWKQLVELEKIING